MSRSVNEYPTKATAESFELAVAKLVRFEKIGTQIRETIGSTVPSQGGVSVWMTLEEADALEHLLRALA